jgi:hypothetical protein
MQSGNEKNPYWEKLERADLQGAVYGCGHGGGHNEPLKWTGPA